MATAVAHPPRRVAERLTPSQRLAQLDRGEVRIPLACHVCLGCNLDTNEDGRVVCLHCGRTASEGRLHAFRRDRIAAYLRTGQL